MSSSQAVYTQIAAKLQTVHPNLHWRRLGNWIWIIVALVQAQSVHLSQLALHIPARWRATSPGQSESQPAGHTEFVTCDYTIERTFEEVKKRSKKMAAAFRNEGSCLLLFYAVVRTLRLRKIRISR